MKRRAHIRVPTGMHPHCFVLVMTMMLQSCRPMGTWSIMQRDLHKHL